MRLRIAVVLVTLILLSPVLVHAEEASMRITDVVAPSRVLPGKTFTMTVSVEWSGLKMLASGHFPPYIGTISPPPKPPYGFSLHVCEGDEESCDPVLGETTDQTIENSGAKAYNIQLTAPKSVGSWRVTVSFTLVLSFPGGSVVNIGADQRTIDVNITDKVGLTVQIRPEIVNVPVSIDGSSLDTDSTGRAKSQLRIGERYSIQVPPEVATGTGVRLVFVKWSDGETSNQRALALTDDTTITAEYKAQHLLTVDSPTGNAVGSGWYDAGSTATFSVTSTLPVEGFLGTLGSKYVFDHWSGDSTATTASASVRMDGPKSVRAEWRVDNAMPFMIMGAVGATVSVIVALLLFVKRRKASPAPTAH